MFAKIIMTFPHDSNTLKIESLLRNEYSKNIKKNETYKKVMWSDRSNL